MKQTKLLIAILASILLTGCGNPYTLTEANLPEAAPYPNEQEFIDPVTGEYDDERMEAAYNAWENNLNLRENLPEDYLVGVQSMTQAAAAVFLTGKSENTVYAPLNTYLSLTILAELTDGDGRQEILDLLAAPDMDTLRSRANGLWRANYSNDGANTVILSSSLWLDRDVSYHMDTLNRLTDTYYADTYQGDMGDKNYDAAMQKWLNEKTGGLLRDAVDGLETKPETVLAMLSTIYYQAKWDREFQESGNTELTFHGTAGDTTCTFMVQTVENGTYYGSENFSAFCRRMEEGGEMWFILPDEDATVDTVLCEPDMYTLIEAPYDWTEQKRLVIHEYVPKFDISDTFDMLEGMEKLGIVTPQNPDSADFSPLTEMEGVYVGSARQATRVAIDEEGVTAASFVEMMKAGDSLPPEEEIDFVLDRPFVFAVTGHDNVVLFMGVVNQP